MCSMGNSGGKIKVLLYNLRNFVSGKVIWVISNFLDKLCFIVF